MSDIRILKAELEDMGFVLSLIQELAEFEKAPDAVKVTQEQLETDYRDQLFRCVCVELDGIKVGMALYYFRYSTWKGKNLYLEDLYVKPEARGHGIGKKVMKYLAEVALNEKCGRFEWQVLDWNTPAIDFYKTLEADIDGEWMNCRLEGEAITKLSKRFD